MFDKLAYAERQGQECLESIATDLANQVLVSAVADLKSAYIEKVEASFERFSNELDEAIVNKIKTLALAFLEAESSC